MGGKLIRLFLVDGSPNGIKTLEISNMTIYATIFPRPKLKEFLKRLEADKPGSYILLGNSIEDPEETILYIGEGDPVSERLKTHAIGKNQKDFWDEAIVFTSKDDYITKTQIQYLESEMFKMASEAEGVRLVNAQKPSTPNLSEVDNAEMKDFLEGIKLILSSIEMNILESSKGHDENVVADRSKIFRFKIKGALGKMKIEEDKYIVLKGSTAVINNRPSAGKSIKRMRRHLKEKGIMKKNRDETFFVFQEDYKFTSPSYAAAAIAGGNENGRQEWKYNGLNLNQLEEKEIREI